jgi:hypothetical protein
MLSRLPSRSATRTAHVKQPGSTIPSASTATCFQRPVPSILDTPRHHARPAACRGGGTAACSSTFSTQNTRRCPASRRSRLHSAPPNSEMEVTADDVEVFEDYFPPLATARFIRDKTAFAEEYRIMGHEAGPDQRATVATVANLLQVNPLHHRQHTTRGRSECCISSATHDTSLLNCARQQRWKSPHAP